MQTDNHVDGRRERSLLLRLSPRGARAEQLKRRASSVTDVVAFFGVLLSIAVLLDVLLQPLGPKIAESASDNGRAALTGGAQGMARPDDSSAVSSTDLTRDKTEAKGLSVVPGSTGRP